MKYNKNKRRSELVMSLINTVRSRYTLFVYWDDYRTRKWILGSNRSKRDFVDTLAYFSNKVIYSFYFPLLT